MQISIVCSINKSFNFCISNFCFRPQESKEIQDIHTIYTNVQKDRKRSFRFSMSETLQQFLLGCVDDSILYWLNFTIISHALVHVQRQFY